MKISAAIATLTEIQAKFGDISITGGYLSEDRPPTDIVVIDIEGFQAWPYNQNEGEYPIGGVFIE